MEAEARAAPGTATVSADEFQALESKVMQAVETIRRERDARAAVEAERDVAQAEIADLHKRLSALEETAGVAQTELEALRGEREGLRERVERMLQQMDELL